jgi:hypothetical protein
MKAASLLVSDKFSHHERILHPGQVVEVRGLKSEIGKRQQAEVRGSHPFHDKTVERMGHPALRAG